MTIEDKKILKKYLDSLYEGLNRRCYVHPDPLEFLYDYHHPKDREIVALVGACLAYGRVTQILKSVSTVLRKLGPTPHEYLKTSTKASLSAAFTGFCHRFAKENHLIALLWGMSTIIKKYGSLYECFMEGTGKNDADILQALIHFVSQLTRDRSLCPGHLIPDPGKGSACKRLHLFLRWMVREDQVDPGGWNTYPASNLLVPVDTHMHKVGLILKMTSRKQADLKCAQEITNGFKAMVPQDPVRYDFALTRLGIRQKIEYEDVFKKDETMLR